MKPPQPTERVERPIRVGADGHLTRKPAEPTYRIEECRMCHGCAQCEPQGECNDAEGCDGSGLVPERPTEPGAPAPAPIERGEKLDPYPAPAPAQGPESSPVPGCPPDNEEGGSDLGYGVGVKAPQEPGKAAPAAESLPPRPSMDDFARPATLERFGLEWVGPHSPVATRMPDGYWTPWHIAEAELAQVHAANEANIAKGTDMAERLADRCEERDQARAEAERFRAERDSARGAIETWFKERDKLKADMEQIVAHARDRRVKLAKGEKGTR